MRKLSIIFAFLLSYMGGVNSALAQITENFDDVTITTNAQILSNGWIAQGSSTYLSKFQNYTSGTTPTSGGNFVLLENADRTYGESGKSLGAIDNTNGSYIIIPKNLSGVFEFHYRKWAKNSYTTSSIAVYAAEFNGTDYTIGSSLGTLTVSSTTWSTTKKTINLGDEPTCIAIAMNGCLIDEVTYNEATIQNPKPKNLSVSKQGTTAIIHWEAGSNENKWDIAYSTDANANVDELSTTEVNTTSYELSNLEEGTTYYIWIRSKYGDNAQDYSKWMTGSFYLGYSTPTPTSVDGDGITNVTFGTREEVVNYNTSKTPYYQDNSAQVGTVYIGQDAELAVTFNTGYTYATIVWVDWNQNYEFEGNEVVAVGECTNSKPSTLMLTFPIPASQASGNYRMRIGAADTYYDNYKNSVSSAANANPSPNSSYTVVHDYTLKVKEQPAYAMNIDNKALDFGTVKNTTTSMTFTIVNDGSNALTGVNVTSSDDETFTVSDTNFDITIGESKEITVTFVKAIAGDYSETITVSQEKVEDIVVNVTATYVAPTAATMDVTLNGEAVTETVDFGTVRKETTKTFIVNNAGDVTLNASIASNNTTDFTVTPETLTIAGGETGEFTVTFMMSEDYNAEKNANITLSAEGLESVVIAVKGTRTDAWGEDFEEATSESLVADGWEVSSGWTIGVVSNDPNNDTKQMHISNDYDYSFRSLVTPKLNAIENDVLTFDAYYNYGDEAIKVSYSTDKTTWVEIVNEDNNDVSNNSKTITINAPLTGNFYLKFEARYGSGFDNIAGFKLAPAATVLDQNTANTITTGVQDITLNYMFSKAAGRNYNTIAVPFEITDLSIFGEGVKAYTLQSYDEANSNVTFSEVETLEAGKPYMLHADTPTSESTFNFYNVDVTSVDEGETAITGVTFHANYSYKAAGDISGEWYGVNSTTGNVQKAGTTTHLLAFRGYFTFDGTVDPARLNVTFLDNDGGATSINGTEVFNNQTGDIYDLSGRKVLNAQKGIYIQNGKKVVIK